MDIKTPADLTERGYTDDHHGSFPGMLLGNGLIMVHGQQDITLFICTCSYACCPSATRCCVGVGPIDVPSDRGLIEPMLNLAVTVLVDKLMFILYKLKRSHSDSIQSCAQHLAPHISERSSHAQYISCGNPRTLHLQCRTIPQT